MSGDVLRWLFEADEPWTRYRALLDLEGRPADDPTVRSARQDMLTHPRVQGLVAQAASWPGPALKRHNDASHPLYALGTLADFGLGADDPGVGAALAAVLSHQSPEGAFQSLLNIAPAYGGSGADQWAWVLCDAPTLLYALLAMGLGGDARVQRAVDHLAGLAGPGGWPCGCAPELGRFRGPGRKGDPCPVANVYALKALSLLPGQRDSSAARAGAEMLLGHWEQQRERKFYLFGVGSDFRKLKYPFVWYDILHVAEVLSRFAFVHGDARFREMVGAILAQAGPDGRYTAGSMYQAWKDWSFADKKHPSPWLTLLVLRLEGRIRHA